MPRVAESAPNEQSILERLSAPFDPRDLAYKCQAVSRDRKRALAIWYADARAILDQLDLTVGPENWQDRYEDWGDGCVVCRLSIRFGDRWITKCDVGGPNDHPDDGEPKPTFDRKAAFSDSLKRAAVRFGIGRYLYQLEGQWLDWNDVTGQFTQQPRLPDWALPEGTGQQRTREPGDVGIQPETMKRLQTLIASLRKSESAVRVSLRARFQVETLDALTEQQGQELANELERIERAMQNNGASRSRMGRRGGAR
jgi:hypothetical protein